MCSETFLAQRPALRRRGRHGGGISPCPATAPAAGQPASLPRPELPVRRESPAGGTALQRQVWHWGEDGAFPEQVKSSKTLSCQFEEAYAFCKFLES